MRNRKTAPSGRGGNRFMPLEDARAAHPKNNKNNNDNTSLLTAQLSSLDVDSVVSAI